MSSALAASALPSLVLARGHRIEKTPELPLVVGNDAESLSKTKAAIDLLKRVVRLPSAAAHCAWHDWPSGYSRMPGNIQDTPRRILLVRAAWLEALHCSCSFPVHGSLAG